MVASGGNWGVRVEGIDVSPFPLSHFRAAAAFKTRYGHFSHASPFYHPLPLSPLPGHAPPPPRSTAASYCSLGLGLPAGHRMGALSRELQQGPCSRCRPAAYSDSGLCSMDAISQSPAGDQRCTWSRVKGDHPTGSPTVATSPTAVTRANMHHDSSVWQSF